MKSAHARKATDAPKKQKPAQTASSAKSTSVTLAPAPRKTERKQAVSDILGEIRELRAMVTKLLEPPPSAQAVLEQDVDSLRRLLSELLEKRMESVLNALVGIRMLAATGAQTDWQGVVRRLDELLKELGAIEFRAERLDYFDPLIHTVVGERHDPAAPDGVIIETIRPGYRTARGVVLAKAAVAVNRRK